MKKIKEIKNEFWLGFIEPQIMMIFGVVMPLMVLLSPEW